MSIDPRLMEILVCPACHGQLRIAGEGEGLECTGCKSLYPVRDGIPIMLIEEARRLEPEGDEK